MTNAATGSDALALGALDAGVEFVTGYPGSPSTATFEALLRHSTPGPWPRVEWSINEKSALDAAIGASLAGVRALVCVKSVGLDVALNVSKTLYDGYKDVKWRPNRTMEQLAISGDLGRKTGKGWYDYTSGEKKPRTDIEF